MALVLPFAAPQALATQPLPDPRLRQAALDGAGPALADLKTMVDIPSGSHQKDGLSAMADFLDKRLRDLSARVERISVPPADGQAVMGQWTGKGRGRILILAHMDTVYPSGSDPSWRFHSADGRATGPGVVDDKGGIAVVLQALAMLERTGFHDYGRLTVLFTPDEEIGSPGSASLIERLAREHDYVFSCEPGGHERIIATSGIAKVTMQVTGVASHAGVAPEAGRNALVEAADMIGKTSDLSDPARGLKFNWTVASSGKVSNIIPAEAQATGDMRFIDPADPAALMARLAGLAATPKVAGTQVAFSLTVNRPPMRATPAAQAMARLAQTAGDEIGFPITVSDQPMGGGSDAAFAARPGTAAVVESFGPGGGHGHTQGMEYVDIATLGPSLYVMARVITRLAHSPLQAPR